MSLSGKALRLLGLAALVAATLLLGRAGQAALCDGPRSQVASLPAIPFLRTAALGYREAMADLAWMQAVQYYGEHRQGGNDLSEFGYYVTAVNALDPRYEHAYILGAMVLATDGHNLPDGLELLRRGARANPDSYALPFEMGFLNYIAGGPCEASVRYFGLAAQYPEGRDRALRFQAFLNRKLGRMETAWLLWNDLYQHTDNASLKIVAAESLRKLEAAMRQKGQGSRP
jgi:hypothetical protein